MKKILITGGNGFVGSNLINYLKNIHPSYYIISLDKQPCKYNQEIIKLANKNIQGDINNRKFIFDLFAKEQFDIVINCANESNICENLEDKSVFIITNIIGTQTLLDASKEFGVKRYHQVSTKEVEIELESHLSPVYISSRKAADLLVIAYEKEYGLRATISRYDDSLDGLEKYLKNIDQMINKEYRIVNVGNNV